MGKWYLHEFASSDRGFDSTNPNFKCNSLNYVPEEGLTSNGKFTSMESLVPLILTLNEFKWNMEPNLRALIQILIFYSHLNMTTGRIEHFKVPIRVPKLNSPLSSIWDAKTLNGKPLITRFHHVFYFEIWIFIPGDTKMLVLAVDREHANWYLLYSCSIIGTRKYRWETVGIWSRFKSIEPSLRNILKDYLIGLGLPIQSHKFHSQENC